MQNLTPLPRLASKLRDVTGATGPGYRRCYSLVLDGRLPTETVNGRLYIRDEDLPAVAQALGLTLLADRVTEAA